MRWVFRGAVRAAWEEVIAARLGRDERRRTRAWKLFSIEERCVFAHGYLTGIHTYTDLRASLRRAWRGVKHAVDRSGPRSSPTT